MKGLVTALNTIKKKTQFKSCIDFTILIVSLVECVRSAILDKKMQMKENDNALNERK